VNQYKPTSPLCDQVYFISYYRFRTANELPAYRPICLDLRSRRSWACGFHASQFSKGRHHPRELLNRITAPNTQRQALGLQVVTPGCSFSGSHLLLPFFRVTPCTPLVNIYRLEMPCLMPNFLAGYRRVNSLCLQNHPLYLKISENESKTD
jgi:hypothetical protein